MQQRSGAERQLTVLLRLVGVVCLVAVVPLVMPRSWIAAAHAALGWGEFPHQPIAQYLARSTSGLCALYGGLLLVLSSDVRRYAPVIRYQASAIMLISACGALLGVQSGMPLWFVVGDAAACWLYSIPMLVLAHHVDRGPV